MKSPHETFLRLSRTLSAAAGTWQAFTLALVAVIAWVITGFFVGFADQIYQLSINTGTTIVTFLMLFLLQGSQNRDMVSIHIKLDELVLNNQNARNALLAIEDADEATLKAIRDSLRQQASS